MKTATKSATILMCAIILGLCLPILVSTTANAESFDSYCNLFPRGPMTVLTCDTGSQCTDPEYPYYIQDCEGTNPQGPCFCEWVGCHDDPFGNCD